MVQDRSDPERPDLPSGHLQHGRSWHRAVGRPLSRRKVLEGTVGLKNSQQSGPAFLTYNRYIEIYMAANQKHWPCNRLGRPFRDKGL